MNWQIWVMWGLAFLAFPVGGLVAQGVAGPINTPWRAVIGGALTGLVLGGVQYLLMRGQLAVSPWWVVATAAAAGVGMGLAHLAWGSETGDWRLLARAGLTGAMIAVVQWGLLQPLTPAAWVWPLAVATGWVLGWTITRAVGVDLSPQWSVFGSTGAWAFQALTGLAWAWMVRNPTG